LAARPSHCTDARASHEPKLDRTSGAAKETNFDGVATNGKALSSISFVDALDAALSTAAAPIEASVRHTKHRFDGVEVESPNFDEQQHER